MEIAEQIRPKEMGDLFNQRERLRIPSYQRRFSWEEEQFEDLWNDLDNVGKGESHFFGTIVFMSGTHVAQGTNEIDIVDGQQRITTISILLCAIRDYLQENFEEDEINERIDTIEQNLWLVDRDGERQGMRLELGNLDHDSYESLVNSRIDEIDNENIASAYEYFYFKKRIGNLTLLEEDPNISASNRSLEKKQDYYTEDETDFEMTHELKNKDKWDIEEIEERSKRLAEMASKVWSL